jgi:hypothetical protein
LFNEHNLSTGHAFIFPLLLIWFVTYWTAKFPAHEVGYWVIRSSPNQFSDAAICALLTLLFIIAALGAAIIWRDYVVLERYPYPLEDRATIIAVMFSLPIFLALFKGTRHARENAQAP